MDYVTFKYRLSKIDAWSTKQILIDSIQDEVVYYLEMGFEINITSNSKEEV